MPVINFISRPGTTGPIIKAILGVTSARIAAGGIAVASIPVDLLVDTGASASVFSLDIFNRLKLTPVGFSEMLTPSTGNEPHPCATYDVALTLDAGDNTQPLTIEPLNVMATDLELHNLDGLIGRDVLSRCHFTYNGTTGQCSLAF